METLELVKDAAPRERLLEILKQDVSRLDRLITDISNASRLDAELSREPPAPFDLARLLRDIVAPLRGRSARQGAVTSDCCSGDGGDPCRSPAARAR